MYTLEALNRLISKQGIRKTSSYVLSEDFPGDLKKQLEKDVNFSEYLKNQYEKYGVAYNGELCTINS